MRSDAEHAAHRFVSSSTGGLQTGLRKTNIIWAIGGITAYAAAQWGTLVILAKLGTTVMVGQVTLGYAISAPVFLLANLRLRAVLATDAAAIHRVADYVAVRLGTSLLALLVVAIVSLLYAHEWITVAVILLVAWAKFIESGSDLIYGLLQREERMDHIAASLLARGVFAVLLVSALLVTTGSVVWAAAGIGIAWTLVLAAYDVPCGIKALRGSAAARTTRLPFWSKRGMKNLAWQTLPLGVAAALASLCANAPRYFIESQLSSGDLGLFGALANIGAASNTIVNAISESAMARLGWTYSNQSWLAFTSLFLKLIAVAVAIGLCGVGIALCWGPLILTLIYRAEYARQYRLLVLLMIAAGFTNVASMTSQAMIATRRFRMNLWILTLTTVVTVVSAALLVPSCGLEGGAIAMTIGMLIMSAAGGSAVRSVVKRAMTLKGTLA